MPEVDIVTINNAVKTYAPIAKALIPTVSPNTNVDWIDKVSGLLDNLVKVAALYQQAQPQRQADKMENVREVEQAGEVRLPPPTKTTNNMMESKQMQVIKLIMPMIGAYVEKCMKENPKMPLGEALAKLDIINISDVNEILNQYKKSQGL
jgi:hypothetical protein